MCAYFAVAAPTLEVTATVGSRCLANTEKALNLRTKHINRHHVLIDGNRLNQKALSLCGEEASARGPLKGVIPHHLLQFGDGYRDAGIGSDWTININRDAASADAKAAVTFLAVLRKSFWVRYCSWFQRGQGGGRVLEQTSCE